MLLYWLYKYMPDLNLLRTLAQYSSNWKIIFKDWMQHCDPKLVVIRIHGWYFCFYKLLKHTWASCKIIYRLGDCKMHQNDKKCGDLVDFVASQSHFVLWKWSCFFLGGGGRGAIWVYLGPLVQKIRIWALMKSNGHNIKRNGLYHP